MEAILGELVEQFGIGLPSPHPVVVVAGRDPKGYLVWTCEVDETRLTDCGTPEVILVMNPTYQSKEQVDTAAKVLLGSWWGPEAKNGASQRWGSV